MSHQLPATNGVLARGTTEYTRHRPEQTLLYQVVEEYYPEFLSHLSDFVGVMEGSLPSTCS